MTIKDLENKISLLQQQLQILKSGSIDDQPLPKSDDQAFPENDLLSRFVYEHSKDSIGFAHKGTVVSVNPAYLALFGYSHPDELVGKAILTCIAKSEHTRLINFIQKRAKGEQINTNYETRGLRKDGSEFDMDVNISTIELNDESYNLVILRDITENKLTENKLQESEEKYRTIVDNTMVGVFRSDIKGNIHFVNDAIVKQLEYNSKEEILAQPSLILYKYPEQRTAMLSALKQNGSVENFEITIITQKQSEKVILMNAVLNGDILDGTVIDITDRKKAEKKLFTEKKLLSAIIENSPDQIYYKDKNGRFIIANSAVAANCGAKTAQELIGKTDFDFFQAHLAKQYFDDEQSIMKSGLPLLDIEETCINKTNNDVRYNLTSKIPVKDSNGKVIGLMGINKDITDRKKVEETIRRNEMRLRGLVEILQFRSNSNQEFLDNALEEAIKLADSKIGFIFFYDEEKKELALNTWSKEVMNQCSIANFMDHYPLEKTGLWGEAVRQRKPILVNDYQGYHPLKKGYPEGHAHLSKFLSIPIIKDDHIVAVVGVGNKETDYDETDVLQLTLLMDAVWQIVENKKGEELLRKQERFLSTLADNIPGMVGYWNKDLTCGFANAAYLEWFGKTRQEMKGIHVLELMGETLFIKNKPFIDKALLGERVDFERTLVKANGEEGYTWAHYIPDIQDGNVKGFYVLVSDITEIKKAEFALAENEHKFRTVADFAYDWEYWRGADGQFIYNSPSCERISGYKPEEFLSDNMLLKKIIHPDDIEKMKGHFEEGQSLEHAHDIEELDFRLIKKDGKIVHIAHLCRPVFDDNSNYLGQRVSNRDITERYQIQEYGEMGKEILQILNETGDLPTTIQNIITVLKSKTGFDAVGIRMQNGDDYPYFAQEGFTLDFLSTENTLVECKTDGGICRYKDGSICLECTCGQVISEKTDPNSESVTRGGSCWSNDKANSPFIETRLHPRDRCVHDGYQSVALVPIRNKERVIGLIQLNDKRKGLLTLNNIELLEGIASHIGSALIRKEAEQKLIELNNELKITTAKATEMARQAELANKSKSLFLANMSHEIRTPLNAIIGFSQLISRDKQLTDVQKEYNVSIIRAGEHLLALINDILELSKVEAGRAVVNPKNFDLHALLKDIQMVFKERAQAKHLQFIFETDNDLPLNVITDEGKLRQIFINLIGNAVKFTDEGGVSVRVGGNKTEKNSYKLMVEIQDTGPGISEHEQSNLFKHFVQTSSGINKGSGTGLGLALSRELAILLGGNITISSEPDKGSLFAFQVEINIGDVQKLNKDIGKHILCIDKDQKPYQILVVDDRIENLQVAVDLLKAVGFETIEATNGQEAIQQFEKWNPDLILMDMRMPGMDGYEASRLIKSTEKGAQTPIIALTASTFEWEQTKIRLLNLQGYISKPFRENNLFETIGKVLDVKYIYEKPTVSSTNDIYLAGDKSIIEDIAQLPAVLLIQMQKAVSVADFEKLIKLIKSIASDNPELARQLMVHANNYDYDFLHQILRKKEEE